MPDCDETKLQSGDDEQMPAEVHAKLLVQGLRVIANGDQNKLNYKCNRRSPTTHGSLKLNLLRLKMIFTCSLPITFRSETQFDILVHYFCCCASSRHYLFKAVNFGHYKNKCILPNHSIVSFFEHQYHKQYYLGLAQSNRKSR